jgi:hypothetical protein
MLVALENPRVDARLAGFFKKIYIFRHLSHMSLNRHSHSSGTAVLKAFHTVP